MKECLIAGLNPLCVSRSCWRYSPQSLTCQSVTFLRTVCETQLVITRLLMTQFNAIITDRNIRILNRSFYSTYGLPVLNFSSDFRTEVISMKFEEFAKIRLVLSVERG